MKRVIVSGYFNPLHGGHLDMIEAAGELGDHLIVIVNNDDQQILKKGKIILDQDNRARLMNALKHVHEVVISVDKDPPVIETLKQIRKMYPNDEIVFANGGDRDGERVVPETDICQELDIEMLFGVGSHEVVKRDSSSRINQENGHEK
jgi:glycerol-3-phosphate cytidylyltransferase/D-beta-D-heptose 7-phosphate kinase/D-beta-D-heptose 1-phosphate adenosyltransferase